MKNSAGGFFAPSAKEGKGDFPGDGAGSGVRHPFREKDHGRGLKKEFVTPLTFFAEIVILYKR